MDKATNITNATNLNSQLARTVKRLRVQKSLSQEELALLAKVDRTYISGIERARRNITIATLERLIPHLCSGPVEFFKELSSEVESSSGIAPTTYSEVQIPHWKNAQQ